MFRVKYHSRIIFRLTWFFVSAAPILALWALCLGLFKLDIRSGWDQPILDLPGWFRHEIVWFIVEPPV